MPDDPEIPEIPDTAETGDYSAGADHGAESHGASQGVGIHNLSVPAGTLAVGNYLVKVQVGDRVATRRLTVVQ